MFPKIRMLAACAVTLSLCVSESSIATAADPAGGIWQRVDDSAGPGRCIAQSDSLSITLRQIVLEKTSPWLGAITDSSIGIPMTIDLSGVSGSNNAGASFARVATEQVSPYSNGKLLLPDEEQLLTLYPLTNGSDTTSVVKLGAGIIRTEVKSEAATIVLGAVSTTQGLSLPVNPYSAAFGVATAYVNGVITPLLNAATGDKAAVVPASYILGINLSGDNCASGDATTGTIALLLAAGNPQSSGYVDISNTNAYCFRNDYRSGAFILTVASHPASQGCAAATHFQNIENSYLLFVVQARPSTSNTTTPSLSTTTKKALSELQVSASTVGALSETMTRVGINASLATPFSKAVLATTLPAAVIAQSFGTSERAVLLYRDLVARCAVYKTKYHLPLKDCGAL